jgi:Fe-S cluster assembly protein SufD
MDLSALAQSHPLFQGGPPDRLGALRAQAIEAFEAQGLPASDHERWRWTPLYRLDGPDFAHHEAVAADPSPFRVPAAAVEVVVVNGRVRPELSRGLSAAVSVLADDRAGTDHDQVARLAGFSGEDQGFVALNTALVQDLVVIHPAKGQDLGLVHLLCLTVAEGEAVVAHPRVLVVVPRGVQLQLIESYAGVGGESLTNAVTEVILEDGADLRHLLIGSVSDKARHVGTLSARLGRDARLHSLSVWSGTGWVRREPTVDLAAPGAEARLDGLFAMGGQGFVDHHTELRHSAPQGTSRQGWRGLVAGEAQAAFVGKIHIAEGAKGTDAALQSRNVLLSDGAGVNAKPELVIHHHDVKAAHGTTVGTLDDDARFYLQSRGLDEDVATAILVKAFAEELVAEVPHASMADAVAVAVERALEVVA